MSRDASWTDFRKKRIGPTTIEDLPKFLENFYFYHFGRVDAEYFKLPEILESSFAVTRRVYALLEQKDFDRDSPSYFNLNRALFRNNEIWNQLLEILQDASEKKLGTGDISILGRITDAEDQVRNLKAQNFICRVVRKTAHAERRPSTSQQKYFIDDIRDYISTTRMLIADCGSELDQALSRVGMSLLGWSL